jgi:hypothetical protein
MWWKKCSKRKKLCSVNIFPNHGVAWEQTVDQYDDMVGFLMMPIFRTQVRIPFIWSVKKRWKQAIGGESRGGRCLGPDSFWNWKEKTDVA